MAYVGVTNAINTNGAGSHLLALKNALKLAGWTPVSSTNGASFSAGDNLGTAALFGAAGAWIRMQEPVPASPPPGYIGPREYILQNATANGANVIIKYSRASKFTGGSPSSTVAPTTGGGDGVVVAGTGTDAAPVSAAWCNTAASGGYIQAIASNTASPGVYGGYAFYVFGYTVAPVGVPTGIFMSEAVTPGSTSSLDQDPMFRYGPIGGQVASASFLIGPAYTNSYPGHSWWEAYGLPGQIYRVGGSGTFYGARTPSTTTFFDVASLTSNSPYDGQEAMYPALMGRSGITSIAGFGPTIIPKGFSTGMLMYYAAHNLLDTFNLNTADPRIAILTSGGGTIPGVAIPWITNIVPAV